MIVDDDGRTYLWVDAELSADPSGSTPVLEVTLGDTPIAGSPFEMAWQGVPVDLGTVETPGPWTQTARTTVRFCGSNATAGAGDVKPGAGSYYAQLHLDAPDGQIPVGELHRLEIE